LFYDNLVKEDSHMFKDELRHKVWDEIRQHDLRAFCNLLTDDVFVEAAELARVTLGRSPLSVAKMVWLGISGAIHVSRNFADVLQLTLKLLEDASDWRPAALPKADRAPKKQRRKGKKNKPAHRSKPKRSKHDPRGASATCVTEEAFAQARKRMPLSYWVALVLILGQRFEKKHAAWIHWKQFRLLAMDGTTIRMDGWRRLKNHFGTAKNGKSKGRTQVRMVMLQMPLVRMPWRYVVGPLDRGEQTMAAELLESLRANDLVLLDRGFWSYGLFHQIQSRQAYFAIRLKTGVRLRTRRHLGHGDRTVRWPMPTRPHWRRSGLPKDIELRVVNYQIPGFRSCAIVTNILSPRTVSRKDWVRLATETDPGDERLGVGLYHRRWEIETTFYELKVTQGLVAGLRGRTPEAVYYEIAGHVVLYLLVRWLMVEAAVATGLTDPLRLSFKAALGELFDMRQLLMMATPERVRDVLLPRLLERIAKHTVPLRPGRHFPRPHDMKTKNCGRGRRKRPHKLRHAA
jgi:hypothetical protein